VKGIPFETFHKHQCSVCPLNRQNGFKLHHPHMPAYGNARPRVYMLGEAPGAEEDKQGIPFVGASGSYLHMHIPRAWEPELRWNNVVRTRPEGNKTPEIAAIEACRPSVEQDIEESQPEAIFGFGNIPLRWATEQSGISDWRGRRIPVQIGHHICWFFPMLHPAYIKHLDNDDTRKLYEQMKFVFELDLRRAFAAVEDGLPEPVIHTEQDATDDIELLYTPHAIQEALSELWNEPAVGLDLETVGLRPYSEGACILTVALSGRQRTVAFPLYHRDARWSVEDRTYVEDMFIEFIRSAPATKLVFTPFELEWIGYFYGTDLILAAKWGDGQALAYILDGRSWKSNSLNNLCLETVGLNIKAINNTDRNNLDITPLSTVLQYNAIDGKYHRIVHETRKSELADRGLVSVYKHHMRRTQAAVLQQIKGIPVDQDTVEDLVTKYETKLHDIEKEIGQTDLAKQFKEEHGHAYRPSAPKDTMQAFRPIGVFLDDATEESVEKIDDPLAKLHLKWKEAAKVLSTYILPCRATGKESRLFPDGMLHPQLALTKVRTWRSSSTDINVQNFPKHYGDAHEVRDMIRPPLGYRIVSFDWGQIQARNVAMESKDRALVKSFWDRHDIHNDWRDRIFQLYPSWAAEGLKTVLKDKKLMKFYRNQAKNKFVFASFFGAGGRKVANTLGVPEDVGFQLAEEFDEAFPEVTDWHNRLHQLYEENGYCTGLSGFRRYAPVAHTEIINTPIQSDEAIMVFDGMIRLAETGDERLVSNMMIHDALEFMWPKEDVDELAEIVINKLIIECPFKWAKIVPLQVEMGVGDSWDKMEDVGQFESKRDGTWEELKKS